MTTMPLQPVNGSIAAPQSRKLNPPLKPTEKVIRTANTVDQKHMISTLVLAFSSDPLARWQYPDPYQYLTFFPRFVQAFGGKAFEHRTAYASDDYSGAALWFPPGVKPAAEPMAKLLQQSVFEAEQTDVFALFEEMDRRHPQFPHWYLPMIGVEPAQQGKGYGSALMQSVLRQCDRDRIPAYLESSNSADIPFYERQRFEALGAIQTGNSPPVFPMIRHPS